MGDEHGWVHPESPGEPQPALPGLPRLLEAAGRKHILLPALAVLAMIGLAIGVQPRRGPDPATQAGAAVAARPAPSSPTPTLALPTATLAAPGTATSARPAANAPAAASPSNGTVTSEVAGARATPVGTPTPDLSRQSTQCGLIKESAAGLSVQATLSGVSVQATHAAVYPADYFRCILMATGGSDATAIATAIGAAQKEGATHAVVIDLWVTNGARDFAQVNLKTSNLSAAGQSFSPLATLNGRSEVVVSSGQGRTVSIIGTLSTALSGGTGPITLAIDAPLIGGQPTAGKYQLFLPLQ